jgi:uncharacterized protein
MKLLQMKNIGSLLFLSLFLRTTAAQDLPYVLLEDVRVTMRDGTELAGYLSYPKNAQPSPVLFRFSSYPRPDDINSTKFIFAMTSKLGYAFAEFHIRGKGNSGGRIEPFEHDANDVNDIIDWLSKQSWSNGEVGMAGGSYLGFTQWAALKNPHPALKTIVPMVSVAPAIDFPIVNGVFFFHAFRWASVATNHRFTDDSLYNNKQHWENVSKKYYHEGKAFNKLDSIEQKPRPIFQRWLQHPVYDAYWAAMIPSTPKEYARINIPILSMTGYFDDDQRGAMHYYNMHQRHGNKEAIKNHFLFIGPYDHYSGQGQRHMPNYQNHIIDSSAYVNKIQLNVEWFNHVFKGAPRPALIKDRVNYFLMGVGWEHGPSLQSIARDTLSLYLYPGSEKAHHLIDIEHEKTKSSLSINFDSGITQVDTLHTSFSGDQYLTHDQQLVFDSEPF